ncbi:MAG: hypothetical protein EOP09_12225, partial [Proteobacteria bacterium]
MKTISTLVMMISLWTLPVRADTAEMHASLDQRFSALQSIVREGVILPVTQKADGNVKLHRLENHSLNIQWESPTRMVLRTEVGEFSVELYESAQSDGDLYDVEITDLKSNERIVNEHVFAYGDVLLGVLGGQTEGLTQLRK